ncbi:hypothetical protein OIU76_002325 [Salix suchowensis]|nr:hypothetical protein OIU76_002325 [Salix suchowensis]
MANKHENNSSPIHLSIKRYSDKYMTLSWKRFSYPQLRSTEPEPRGNQETF